MKPNITCPTKKFKPYRRNNKEDLNNGEAVSIKVNKRVTDCTGVVEMLMEEILNPLVEHEEKLTKAVVDVMEI